MALFNLVLIALLLGFVMAVGSAESIQSTAAETNVTVNLALLTSIFVLLSSMAWFVWLTRRAD